MPDPTPIPDLSKSSSDPETVGRGRPFLFVFLKRAIDLLFSFLTLILFLSWLLPLLAVLIKLDSRGPVFFRQKRTGYRGKTFDCFKLRTMRVNAEAHDLQASVDDPRITRMGKFLRVSNLDELPQFFNVFIGNMSIVGPRPHMLKDSLRFSAMFPGYYSRYVVKPGITGLAQIKGYRGPTPDPNSIRRRLEWDLYYTEHATIGMDLRIILLTGFETMHQVALKMSRKKTNHSS